MGSPRTLLGTGRTQYGKCLLRTVSCPNLVSRSAMNIIIRTFSASVSRQSGLGHLPTFPQTSSSELDTLLSHLRDELFIPVHLLKRHRELMYRPRNHHLLRQEDIYFNVDGQAIHIAPKDRVPPLPRKLFTQALVLISAPQDYKVLPGLVLGYNQAKRPLSEDHLEQMIRKLSLSGHIGLIWTHFAIDSEYNGLKLTLPMYREISRGLTVLSNLPDKYESQKALRRASQLPTLLGPPTSFAKTKEDETRMVNDPVVNGTIAGMFAQACLAHTNGIDYNDNVKNAINAFLPGYEEMGLMEWNPLMYKSKPSFETIKQHVLDYSFLLAGLQKAQMVLERTQEDLSKKIPRIATSATSATSDANGQKPQVRLKWLLARTSWLKIEIVKLEKKLDEWRAFLQENRSFLQQTDKEPLGIELYAKVTEKLAAEREAKKARLAAAKEGKEQGNEQDAGINGK